MDPGCDVGNPGSSRHPRGIARFLRGLGRQARRLGFDEMARAEDRPVGSVERLAGDAGLLGRLFSGQQRPDPLDRSDAGIHQSLAHRDEAMPPVRLAISHISE